MEDNMKNDFTSPLPNKRSLTDRKKNKKDKKNGFNVVDMVLILLILAFVVIIVYWFAPSSMFRFDNGQDVTLEYTVELPAVPKDMATQIAVGDNVFDNVGQYALGSVSNVEIDDHVEYIYREESGRIEAVSYSEEGNDNGALKNILVTVTATGSYSEKKGYFVNGCRIAVNKDMNLRFPGFTGKGQCISVTVRETEVKS